MSAEELKLADELFDDAKYQDAFELLDKLSVSGGAGGCNSLENRKPNINSFVFA